MSGREIAAGPLGTAGLFLVNAAAWWESLNVGTVVTAATVVLGVYVLAMTKITEARNKAYVESEKAKMAAFEDAEMTKMRVQQEWEKVNANSLSRQIEEFRRQAAEDARKQAETAEAVQKRLESDLAEMDEDRKRIRKSLHDLNDKSQSTASQHLNEVLDLKEEYDKERSRYQREIETIRRELHELRGLNLKLMQGVDAMGRRVEATKVSVQAIAEDTKLTSESVSVLADVAKLSSGEIPSPRPDPGVVLEPDTDVTLEPIPDEEEAG